MSMMNLEVKDLRLVKMIAAAGSLTKAAERLNVSQPALSRQLIDLEERVGARLFERNPKGMQATAIGNDLLTLADDLLARVDHTETAIAERLTSDAGQLNLAIHCMPIFACLPDVLKLYQERYPNVKLTVRSTLDFEADLKQDSCDLAIIMHNDEKKGLVFENLFSDEVVIIAAPDNPLAARDSIELADFATTDYVSFLIKQHDPLYTLLQANGIEPRSYTMLGEINSLMNMVSTSAGLAFMPVFAARAMLENGKLKACRLKNRPLNATWFMAHRQDRPLPAYSKGLIKLIRELMQS